MFKFLDYSFDPKSYVATFNYQGSDSTIFTEKIEFINNHVKYNRDLLTGALFLAHIIIGTSYYKSHPSKNVRQIQPIDEEESFFFNSIYQEGLSQFAYENNLTRNDLAHFTASDIPAPEPISYDGKGIIILQSGGKDSLLNATLLDEKGIKYTPVFISHNGKYPKVLDELKYPISIITRKIDIPNLKRSGGLSGHVPVTYINQTLALIQAILDNKNTVLTSIGREGEEEHTKLGDLKINHQWSKTATAENLYQNYIHKYLSRDLNVYSPLRKYRELDIAELFAKKCWDKYSAKFSSCNVANYKQGELAENLTWCGKCPKCANSYLLFSPFINAKEQQKLFGGRDLFKDPSLTETFKGLLGVDDVMKPFECVGEVAELREAYYHKQSDYGDLDFKV